MHRHTHRHPNIRKLSIRVALGAALLLPAGAIAAPSQTDSGGGTGVEALAYLSGIAAGTAAEPPPEPGPFHPVDGAVEYGSAEAAFGNARGRPHEGQDIFAPAGTPVVAPMKSVVVETGSDGGRGNWAALYDPRGDRTFVYFHLQEAAEVGAGQRLAPGERVGLVGCTGSCFGDHLHFEIREGSDPYGAAQDPMPQLQRWKALPARKG